MFDISPNFHINLNFLKFQIHTQIHEYAYHQALQSGRTTRRTNERYITRVICNLVLTIRNIHTVSVKVTDFDINFFSA